MESKEKALEALALLPERYRALEQMRGCLEREQARKAEELARALLPTHSTALELQTYQLPTSGFADPQLSRVIGLPALIGSLWRRIRMAIESRLSAITDQILERILDMVFTPKNPKNKDPKGTVRMSPDLLLEFEPPPCRSLLDGDFTEEEILEMEREYGCKVRRPEVKKCET